MRYLSPAWMDAAHRAIAADDSLRAATAGIRLTIEHVATDAPEWAAGGTIRWHIVIDDGDVALVAGAALRFDVRLTTDYATAARIAAGELAAQRAFAEGRLRVGGELALLIRHQRALSGIDDVLAAVRTETAGL